MYLHNRSPEACRRWVGRHRRPNASTPPVSSSSDHDHCKAILPRCRVLRTGVFCFAVCYSLPPAPHSVGCFYCNLLTATVAFCHLSPTLTYLHLLTATVSYCQVRPAAANYFHQLSSTEAGVADFHLLSLTVTYCCHLRSATANRGQLTATDSYCCYCELLTAADRYYQSTMYY